VFVEIFCYSKQLELANAYGFKSVCCPKFTQIRVSKAQYHNKNIFLGLKIKHKASTKPQAWKF